MDKSQNSCNNVEKTGKIKKKIIFAAPKTENQELEIRGYIKQNFLNIKRLMHITGVQG